MNIKRLVSITNPGAKLEVNVFIKARGSSSDTVYYSGKYPPFHNVIQYSIRNKKLKAMGRSIVNFTIKWIQTDQRKKLIPREERLYRLSVFCANLKSILMCILQFLRKGVRFFQKLHF